MEYVEAIASHLISNVTLCMSSPMTSYSIQGLGQSQPRKANPTGRVRVQANPLTHWQKFHHPPAHGVTQHNQKANWQICIHGLGRETKRTFGHAYDRSNHTDRQPNPNEPTDHGSDVRRSISALEKLENHCGELTTSTEFP